MRDQNRIFPFSVELASTWADKCPDWRFGQMMTNVFAKIKADGKDPFYIEDTEFLEYVKQYFK